MLKREDMHDYQRYASEFLLEHPVAGLFLEMGLGKSIITLTAISDLMFDRLEVKKVLIIAPLRVAMSTWPNELKKWEHLKFLDISVVIGTPEQRKAALRKNTFLYSINRENVAWLVKYYEQHRLPWDFDMVVIDELSSFKSHKSMRFKALRKVRPKIKRIVGLTGTPTPNGLMDLWAEIGILDMGERLGKFIGRYREAYFRATSMNPVTGIVYKYEPREGAEELIYSKISDMCISMKALDYLDMPECIYNRYEVELDKNERKLYEKLEKDLLIPFEGGDIDAVNAASLSNKLLQMANGAVYDENKAVCEIHNRKLEALEDLIEAANGNTVLIAYWYSHDRDRILKYFSKLNIRKLKSSKDFENWNNGDIPVALIHPASAGHGLNIQDGGHILIWFGLTWSLELYQQTNARLWRQGQKNCVVIQHITVKDSIDEAVMEALEHKDSGQEKLIEAVRARVRVNKL